MEGEGRGEVPTLCHAGRPLYDGRGGPVGIANFEALKVVDVAIMVWLYGR